MIKISLRTKPIINVHGILKHAMAPLSVPIISHDKSAERTSWARHGSEGFYVGPTQDHYRCFQVLISHTGALRITDTIDWQPDAIHLPGFSFLEILEHNINKLEHTLKGVSTTIDDLNIDDYTNKKEIIKYKYL